MVDGASCTEIPGFAKRLTSSMYADRDTFNQTLRITFVTLYTNSCHFRSVPTLVIVKKKWKYPEKSTKYINLYKIGPQATCEWSWVFSGSRCPLIIKLLV